LQRTIEKTQGIQNPDALDSIRWAEKMLAEIWSEALFGDFVDENQIVGLVKQSCSGNENDTITGREDSGRLAPFGNICDEVFWAIEMRDLVGHDTPEQTHATQGGFRVAHA
jgi:hypothetical protein